MYIMAVSIFVLSPERAPSQCCADINNVGKSPTIAPGKGPTSAQGKSPTRAQGKADPNHQIRNCDVVLGLYKSV